MNKLNKLFLLILLGFFVSSKNIEANPDIEARTAILMDHHSNEILYELNPDDHIYPASMTKIMTSIIAFDLLQSNKISMEDTIVISETAWHMSQSGYSSMFIMPNDQVSVEDLLKGIIIASGNDACVALAEGIAGTEENFVDMMNEKAQEIGMLDTNFANSSGITNPENYSTVRDIALMSKYLIEQYPEYYPMYSEKEFTWDRTGGEPISQFNRNRLLFKNIGADGVKTGYLDAEKYSLASTIKKGTRRLIAVGSGFNSKTKRTSQSIKLLSWGFRNTDTFQVSKKGETFFDIKAWLGAKETIKGITKEDLYVTLKKKNIRNFRVVLEYDGPVKAPIKKDQKIAILKVINKDDVLKTIPIFSSEDIEKINFFKSVFTSLNYMIWGDV